ncbi:tRNA(Met) cytidine acetate ligase [Agathobaculum sp.]|uniref:tRNA(Met) cytidine acetate ligase n=1 Tax=Agathobaculum sp. TaxID=2048138 RepID=UPI002A82F74B|nr:nucleotidyltransferase family protein [Agathobaculum sp.]MDY3618289.1 nucleotidyltransferase family protein [Agathobaculum sp.]
MAVCGVVAEYNPFHTGHAHHLSETRRALGEDTAIVCAMSGNFVQRGEDALVDKYIRAQMAAQNGADLVIELPLCCALSSAEGFARGAVQTLRAFSCDTLSFGCESGDAALIQKAADLLDSLAFSPEKGLSYAASRQKALQKRDPEAAALLDAPNNTLAIEYCRTMRGTGMRPLAIPRLGAAHDAALPADGFASASLLRTRIRAGGLADCAPFLPENVFELLRDIPPTPPLDDLLFPILRRLLSDGALSTGSRDGFDERLAAAVHKAGCWAEAVSLAQTRRFPAARVRRALTRLALGVPADADVLPQYLRVLAVGPKGRVLLKNVRTELPLIMKPVLEKRLPAALQPALSRDAFADDLFALASPDPARRAGGSHFRQTPYCTK